MKFRVGLSELTRLSRMERVGDGKLATWVVERRRVVSIVIEIDGGIQAISMVVVVVVKQAN